MILKVVNESGIFQHFFDWENISKTVLKKIPIFLCFERFISER